MRSHEQSIIYRTIYKLQSVANILFFFEKFAMGLGWPAVDLGTGRGYEITVGKGLSPGYPRLLPFAWRGLGGRISCIEVRENKSQPFPKSLGAHL